MSIYPYKSYFRHPCGLRTRYIGVVGVGVRAVDGDGQRRRARAARRRLLQLAHAHLYHHIRNRRLTGAKSWENTAISLYELYPWYRLFNTCLEFLPISQGNLNKLRVKNIILPLSLNLNGDKFR